MAVAPAGDINILARDVEIIEARETSASQTATKTKKRDGVTSFKGATGSGLPLPKIDQAKQ